jgi:alpha-beta hydrolase superfamily lysophospholipase
VLNRVPPALQDAILDQMVPDSGRAGRDMSITGVAIDATRVRCPVLLVAAQEDRFIPKTIGERVARRYGAPVHMLEAHAHMSLLEPGWEQVADRVERWIAEQP